MRDRSYTVKRRTFVVSVASVLVMVMSIGPFEIAGAAQQNATVTILHGLPGFTADVYVNGKLTLDGFKPKTATPALRLPAGDYDIAIRNVGESPDSQPVLHADVSLDGGINYTIVAHLNGSGDPNVTVFRNGLQRVPVGESRLIVRNVADTPPLTIRVKPGPRFEDLASADVASALVPPARYSIDAVQDGDATPVIPDTRLVLGEGTETIVYVVGSNADGSLDLMSQVVDRSSDPAGVPSGNGGRAAPRGVPPWTVVLVVMGIWLLVWGIWPSNRRAGADDPRAEGTIG